MPLFSVIYQGVNDFFMIVNIESNAASAAETAAYYEQHDYIWVEGIHKCFRYYNSVNKKRINKIYLYGYTNAKEGLDKHLSSILHIDVEFINSVSNTAYVNYNMVNDYFSSVIALHNTKSMNFLTKDDNKQLISLSVIGACVLLFFLLYFSRHTLSLQEEIAALSIHINNEKNIERNTAVEKLILETQSLERCIKAIEEAITTVEKENISTEKLRGIYYSFPEGTRVLSFSTDKNSLNMQCISDSMDEVIFLLEELKRLDYTDKIYVPAVQSKDMKYMYSIICNFKVDYEE